MSSYLCDMREGIFDLWFHRAKETDCRMPWFSGHLLQLRHKMLGRCCLCGLISPLEQEAENVQCFGGYITDINTVSVRV